MWKVLLLNIVLCVFVISNVKSECVPDNEVLKRLLENYDKDETPSPIPVNVGVQAWVSDIRFEGHNVFADIFYNEKYYDERLEYSDMGACSDRIPVGASKYSDRFWTPKTTAINVVSQKQKGDPSKFGQEFLLIFSNGTLWKNVHVSYQLRCGFDSRNFPSDELECTVTFESFQYNTSRLLMSWEMAPMVLPIAHVNEWKLQSVTPSEAQPEYPAGKWAEIIMTFSFKRESCWYVYHGYLPSMICVIACWLSMFLPRSATTARSLIIMTSLLGVIFLAHHMSTFVVGAKTITRMDCWMGGCLLFVLIALIKLTIVSNGCDVRRISKDGYVAQEPEGNAKGGIMDWSFSVVYPLLFAIFVVAFAIFA